MTAEPFGCRACGVFEPLARGGHAVVCRRCSGAVYDAARAAVLLGDQGVLDARYDEPAEPEGLAEARANQADPFGEVRVSLFDDPNARRAAALFGPTTAAYLQSQTDAIERRADEGRFRNALFLSGRRFGKRADVDAMLAANVKAGASCALASPEGVMSGRALRAYLETKGLLP